MRNVALLGKKLTILQTKKYCSSGVNKLEQKTE